MMISMDDKLLVVASHPKFQQINIVSDDNGVMESAYFPTGEKTVISRRILLSLIESRDKSLRRNEAMISIEILKDSDEGSQWFKEVFDRFERNRIADYWELANNGDLYGVAEHIRKSTNS